MEAVTDRGPAGVSTGASTGASTCGSVSSSSRASLFRERANAASLREVESSSRPEVRSRGGTHGRKKEKERGAPPVSWGAQVPQVLSFGTPSHLLKKQPKRPVGMSQGAYDALVHARSLFEAAMV